MIILPYYSISKVNEYVCFVKKRHIEKISKRRIWDVTLDLST